MSGIRYSTPVRNGRLNAIESVIGASAILKLYPGTLPATVATARSGTPLATFNLPADWMSDAANGLKSKLGTWECPSAAAGGAVGYFTIFSSDGATIGLDGLMSQPYAASYPVAVGQQMHNAGNVYKATASTGSTGASSAPTGTGTGITDGSVTWAYVGPFGMSIDNSVIAGNQDVIVSQFDITEGNG